MQTQDDGGVIVNIGSMSGLRPSPGTAVYGAAKAGLHEPHADARDGVGAEGAGERGVGRHRPHRAVRALVRRPRAPDAVAATIPLGRVAEPADVGNAVAFLASPLAAFVSGANLEVHGGGERLAFFDLMT